MSHFGVLSHSGTGHLNPLIALSRQLTARGHRVTFFQKPKLESRVCQQEIRFSSIGKSTHCSEKYRGGDGAKSSRSRVGALRNSVRRIVGEMAKSLRETPAAITQAGIDVLIIDEIILSGPTLAQMLDIPYFVVSTSVPLNLGWSVSGRTSKHRSPASLFLLLENALLQVSALRMQGPVRWTLDAYRRKIGLGPIREIQKVFPAMAQITQLPQCMDFPRLRLPHNFYYTGPFVDESARPHIQFPWRQLDGRPFAYASLGTARAVTPAIFRLIAEACDSLDLQLVISLGGRGDPEIFDDLPGRPLVVKEAPQLQLLKKAEIVITHSGLNTVLEALMEGKPILAIPIAYDQPAVADRLAWLGVSEVLSLEGLATKQIRIALERLLNNESYRSAAVDLQGKIQNACGLTHAADLIEAALKQTCFH
jgi:zeaxanthin glucosyltransferase